MQMLSTGALMNRLNGLGLVFGGVLLALPLRLVPFSNTSPPWRFDNRKRYELKGFSRRHA